MKGDRHRGRKERKPSHFAKFKEYNWRERGRMKRRESAREG
jgi:hypothetical protein